MTPLARFGALTRAQVAHEASQGRDALRPPPALVAATGLGQLTVAAAAAAAAATGGGGGGGDDDGDGALVSADGDVSTAGGDGEEATAGATEAAAAAAASVASTLAATARAAVDAATAAAVRAASSPGHASLAAALAATRMSALNPLVPAGRLGDDLGPTAMRRVAGGTAGGATAGPSTNRGAAPLWLSPALVRRSGLAGSGPLSGAVQSGAFLGMQGMSGTAGSNGGSRHGVNNAVDYYNDDDDDDDEGAAAAVAATASRVAAAEVHWRAGLESLGRCEAADARLSAFEQAASRGHAWASSCAANLLLFGEVTTGPLGCFEASTTVVC